MSVIIVLACSFDPKVQAHFFIGLATKYIHPPKLMRPAGSVSYGFGGTVVPISNGGVDGNNSQWPQRYVVIDTAVG